jgi:hypothetical protein
MLDSARIFLRSIPLFLPALDGHLLDFGPRRQLAGLRRFAVEFFYFGVKEARACLRITTSAITDGTSLHVHWDSMRAQRWFFGRWTVIVACHCSWRSC